MADKQLWQVTPVANDVKNDDGVIIGGQTAGTRYAPLTLIANFVHNLWAAFINAITPLKTSFANGDKFPVVNGSTATAMEASTLLELTAQNALAGNVAPAFIPNETNAVAGMPYVYGGKLYTADEDYNGEWDATKFTARDIDSLYNKIKTFLTGTVSGRGNRADFEQSGYIANDGTVSSTSSWLTFGYVGEFSGVILKGYSNLANPAIAFYSSETPSTGSLIATVKYQSILTDDPQYFFVKVPEGTKYILVCTRTATSTNHEIGVCEIPEKYLGRLLSAVDFLDLLKSRTIDDADSSDNYYYNGTTFVSSSSWTRYFFNVNDNDKEVRCTLYSTSSGFGAIVFLGDTDNVISFVPFTIFNSSQEFKAAIPAGAKKIAVCNRTASLVNPVIGIYSDKTLYLLDQLKQEIDDEISLESQNVNSKIARMKYAATLDDAVGKDNQYGDGDGNFAYSNSWSRYLFDNKDYESVLVTTQITVPGPYVLLAFFDEFGVLINKVSYASQEAMIDEKFDIPVGTKKIAFCNRDESYPNPQVKFLTKDMNYAYETLTSIELSSNVAGVIKLNDMNAPDYVLSVGNIEQIASHFKMALVKDGVVQYTLNQSNILKDINNVFDSVLDGTDGDVLIVNDCPVYMLTGAGDKYSVRLFSLAPFEFDGHSAIKIDVRGDAPSLCFVDNINDSDYDAHEAHLLSGKSHFVRDPDRIAYYLPQVHLDGKYVPSEVGGVISYTYDTTKHFIDSGACRPTVYLNQNTAENAATNKNVSGVVYTNKDLKSVEVILALVEAEAKTNRINSSSLFGMPFSADNSFVVTESLFTDGTLAGNGVRFKNASNEWDYKKLTDEPFGGDAADMTLNKMLTDWMSPWEIMEQHLVLSYAKSNSIAANTWFVYNENEYKYLNVGDLKGLADGVMTAVLFKKFRCKIGAGVTHNGVSVAGNDIEYVILSSMYRGWVLDTSPHFWLTGINCIADDSNHYTLCYEFDYNRYLMNRDYEEIGSGELFDFEKKYSFRSSPLEVTSNYAFEKVSSKGATYVPSGLGASPLGNTIQQYECALFQPDKKKAGTGKKIVQGVKLGYGPEATMMPRNYLYMNHPRTYVVARAGYSSFVCQNVKL